MRVNVETRPIREEEWGAIFSHPLMTEETRILLEAIQQNGSVRHSLVQVYYIITRANQFFKLTNQLYRIRKTVFRDWETDEPGRFSLVAVTPQISNPA